MSETNASSIHHVVITEYDARSVKALKVSVVGDVVFLYSGTVEPETGKCEFPDQDSVAVDAETLYRILGEMMRREDRCDYEKLKAGERPGDSSLVGEKVTTVVPAIRMRVQP